ncbi:hypothetical protein GH146_05010 [archaeon]|nr:hypothetical protein [archaeon]
MLVALTVSTNVFLWTFTQNATYNQAVKESSQMDAALSSERIVAYNTVFLPVSQNEVNVTTTMAAQGALSAQIIRVWVTVDGSDKYGNATVEFNLTPGDTPKTETITVTMTGAIDSEDFNGWLITARGNRVPLEQKRVEEITVSDVTLGIGAISMNFTNFKYYNVTENVDDYVLANYPNGTSGYNVNQPKEVGIPGEPVGVAFQVTLTNLDISNRSITLFSSSLLWMLFPKSQTSIVGSMWYIVNVNDGIIDDDNFDNITINHGSTVNLFFASASDVSEAFLPCLSGYGGTAAVNLALIGQIAGSPYGQNLPFVSIYLTKN